MKKILTITVLILILAGCGTYNGRSGKNVGLPGFNNLIIGYDFGDIHR